MKFLVLFIISLNLSFSVQALTEFETLLLEKQLEFSSVESKPIVRIEEGLKKIIEPRIQDSEGNIYEITINNERENLQSLCTINKAGSFNKLVMRERQIDFEGNYTFANLLNLDESKGRNFPIELQTQFQHQDNLIEVVKEIHCKMH